MSEAELQRQCEKHLKEVGLKYIHIKNNSRQQKYRSSGHKHWKGYPDLFIFLPRGRCLIIELKVEGGKVTPEQEKHLQEFYELGYTTEVCTGFMEFENTLNYYFCRRRK